MSDQDLPSADADADRPDLPDSPSYPTVRFDFQPQHLLRILAVLWAVLALLCWPGVGCWVSAATSALGAWYVRRQRAGWPIDVEDYLVERGWALRRRRRMSESGPPIPFRPMTIPELYGAAAKILLRNWPVLIGFAAVVFAGFGAVLGVAMRSLDAPTPRHLPEMLFSGHDSLIGVAVPAVGLLALLFLVFIPVDALLIVLGVQIAERALRGQRIGFDGLFVRATGRVYAVSRLNSLYYIFWGVMAAVQVMARGSGFFTALIPLMVVCGIVMFLVGMLVSVSPVVMILENRGIRESFARSIQLCRPAVGRIACIHTLGMGCMSLVVVSASISWVSVLICYPVLTGLVRCLPVLIYADLRMRQEDYGAELLGDWCRNKGREGLASG